MGRTVVIGGGSNGLTAAALLAKRGREVLLVEARDVLGGLAASESFHDGYKTAGVLSDTTRVGQSAIEELSLDRYGASLTESRPDVLLVAEKGGGVLLHDGDARLAPAEIALVSERDAERYRDYCHFIRRIRSVLTPLLVQPPPDTTNPGLQTLWEIGWSAVKLRRLGKADMLDLLRIAPMAVADWMNEWFESDVMKTGIAGPGVLGANLGPWSPGSNLNLLLWETLAGGAVRSGTPGLVHALKLAGEACGATLRTGARVRRILTERGRVKGVELGDGETIDADSVLATCDPKQALLDLLPPGTLPHRLERRMEIFRAKGTTAVVHLALRERLTFECAPSGAPDLVRTTGALDDYERAFDVVKYRRFPEKPVLEVHQPSDSSLAPQGHAVATLRVHWVPYDLEGGWTDARREELGDLAVATLARYAPGVKAAIVAREVLTPVDLEERYGLTGGELNHGDHAMDQLILRPTPETARYVTPIVGLHLGGGGSHPGGGLTCLPGWLSAAALVKS